MFEDTEDATEDPEPIMVTQGEKDDTLEAILDKHIGVGPLGWRRSMEQRCAAASTPFREGPVPLQSCAMAVIHATNGLEL